MRRIINIVVVLCFGVLFASCTKEPMRGGEASSEGEVRIVLSVGDIADTHGTKATADEELLAREGAIDNIKVLFYDHDTQKLALIKILDAQTNDTNTDQSVTWKDKLVTIKGVDYTNAYDIYVVANWKEDFVASDFVVGSSITKLSEAFTTITGQIVAPDATHYLLMSGFAKNHNFTGNFTVNIPLVRQVAKISLKILINKNFSDAYPGITFVETGSKLTVSNVPNSSYVSGVIDATAYKALMSKNTSFLLDYPVITLTNYVKTEVYVYENITMGNDDQAKTLATSMTLQLPYKIGVNGETVTTNYYKIYIQDNNDSANPHKTKRNHIYNMTATLNGFGSPVDSDIKEELDVTVKVLPWNTVGVDDAFGRFVVFTDMIEDATVIDGNYEVDDLAETFDVKCNTNIGGWYTVTRNEKGAVIHRSTQTEAVLEATDQTVTIPIPKILVLPDDQKYTVSIYHPIIAMEGIGPVKSFTFSQMRGGFIPNSVLIKAGWPMYSLPKNGLQLARRGDTGVAGDMDVSKPWDENYPCVSRYTTLGLGSGKFNTGIILNTEEGEESYGAAYYCREEMGKDWYLPSKDELMLIFENVRYFGDAYSYLPRIYWTSSETKTGEAHAGQYNMGMGTGAKDNLNLVRCVKNI